MIPSTWFRALPKVELHVHLEGSMRPETLLALATRHKVDLPAHSLAGIRQWFQFRDFDHFVEIYLKCSSVLRAPEDFQRLLRDFAADQKRCGVVYSEVHFTVGTHWMAGLPPDELLDAMAETIAELDRVGTTRVRLIPDIVRDVGSKTADLTLEWAIAGKARNCVVALGLSGREAFCPSEPFAEHFAEAERRGLGCVAHAGEHAGARSIWSVLEACRAQRVGHGVRCLEDPALVAHLRDQRIPLEVCPTSNVRLGVAADLTQHPFERLRREGLLLTINSDDPALFETDVACELEQLATTFGYESEQLAGWMESAVAASFLEDEEKLRLREEIAQAGATACELQSTSDSMR